MLKRVQSLHINPFQEQYLYTFPNQEKVKLIFIKITLKDVSSFHHTAAQTIFTISPITHLQRIIQFMAIRKRMAILKIGQKSDSKYLNHYDGSFISDSSGNRFMMYAGQIKKHFCEVTKPKDKKLLNEYMHILYDLHQHSIILQDISIYSLMYSKSFQKFILCVSQKAMVFDIQLQDVYIQPQYALIQNPYQKQSKALQALMKEISRNPIINRSVYSKEEEQVVVRCLNDDFWIQLLYQVQFISRVIQNKSSPSALDDQTWDQLLKSHGFYSLQGYYECKSMKTNLIQLYAQKLKHIKKAPIYSPEMYEQAEIVTKKLDLLKYQLKYEQNNQKSYSKSHLQTLKKIYYNPLQLVQLKNAKSNKSTSIITKQMLQEKIRLLSENKGENVGNLHFYKAKLHLQDCNFYRALAHLKQADKHMKSPLNKTIITLQIAHIYSRLNQPLLAENHYLQSLAARTSHFGKLSLQLLPIYQTLIYFHYQLGQTDKMIYYFQRAEEIKVLSEKKYLKHQPCLFYGIYNEVILNQIGYYDLTKVKPSAPFGKEITKDQMLKLQLERCEHLSKIWSLAKPIIQKNDKDISKANLNNLKPLLQFGQLKTFFTILKLISAIQTKTELQDNDRQSIYIHIQLIKSTNLNMYYRCIYLLAYYQEKHHPQLSIPFIKQLSTTHTSTLIKTQLYRKMVILIQKHGPQHQLLAIYLNGQQLKCQGLIQQLFRSVLLFEKRGMVLECRKNSLIYLEEFRMMYNTVMEEQVVGRQIKRKVNRSSRVEMALMLSLIKLDQFQQSKRLLIKTLNNPPILTIYPQQIQLILIQFSILAYQSQEYSSLIQIFQTHLQSFQFPPQTPKIKCLWLSIIKSFLQQKIQPNEQAKIWFFTLYDRIKYELLSEEKKELYNLLMQQERQEYLQHFRDLQPDECVQGSETYIYSSISALFMNIQPHSHPNHNSLLKLITSLDTFIKSHPQTDIQTLLHFIIDKLQHQKDHYGKSSFTSFHHILLIFKILQSMANRDCQMVLMLWLIQNGYRFGEVGWLNDVFVKDEMQKCLDEYLVGLFVSGRMLNVEGLSVMVGSWWFDPSYSCINNLCKYYAKMAVEQDIQQQGYKITIFKIKYLSLYSHNFQSQLIPHLYDKFSDALCDEQDQII